MSTTAAAVVPINPAFDLPMRKNRGAEDIRVTPEIARHWLTFNTVNRNIRKGNYEKIKRSMAEGNFADNGDTIVFAPGKLLDGQNRLSAVVDLGITLKMLVSYGHNPEVQSTIDEGSPRTACDVIKIEGAEEWASKQLGTAIHIIIAHSKGLAIYATQRFTNTQVRDFYLEHAGRLVSSSNFCKGIQRKPVIVSASNIIAFNYIFRILNESQADAFFEKLIYGEELPKTSPIYHLRERLLNDLIENRKRSLYERTYFIVRTWNSFRKNTPYKSGTFLYPRSGDTFPEIV